MDKPLIKAAEGALSYVLQIGYEEADDGLKNPCFCFVETVSTEMAQCGALDNLFNRNLEKLTKSPTFMEASTTRTLTSSRFVLSVAKFICAKIEKTTYLGDNIGKSNEPMPPSPPAFLYVSESLIVVKLCKLAANKIKKKTEKAHDDER